MAHSNVVTDTARQGLPVDTHKVISLLHQFKTYIYKANYPFYISVYETTALKTSSQQPDAEAIVLVATLYVICDRQERRRVVGGGTPCRN